MSNPRFESDGGGIELDLAAPTVAESVAAMSEYAKTLTAPSEATERSAIAEDIAAIQAVGTEAHNNASVQGIGSMAGGQLRSVGFPNAEGYIHAIRSGVPARTHEQYLAVLRARFGLTTASLESLKLPGPMVPTALPNGPGIVHKAQGPSVFDRPKSERQFVVGAAKSDVTESPATIKLEHGQLVAGAVAEGCGVLLGWSGSGRLTRGALVEALDGSEVRPPLAKGHRAQAGHVMAKLTREGQVVRVQRGAPAGQARWTVGVVDHKGTLGDAMGKITMTVCLNAEGELMAEGPTALCSRVRDEFAQLMADETYQAGDITAWLSSVLLHAYDAVRFGVGWYVPAKHAEDAGKLCATIEALGWGADWILPALPVATSDQLRDGIVRGLTKEVDGLMAQLATERETAKLDKLTRRASAESMTGDTGLRARNAADALSGDIGERRAASFLKELRDIGQRIVAYGQILGEERLDAARAKVRGAVLELETVLGDDYSGIRSRFCAVWDEIERDRKAAGGVL